MGIKSDFIPIDKSYLSQYEDLRLFNLKDDKMNLFKLKGETIDEQKMLSSDLYIHIDDKVEYIQKEQKKFERKIKVNLEMGNTDNLRIGLTSIMKETLNIPTEKTLSGLSETVNVLVDEISKIPHLIDTLLEFSMLDYSTAVHSINVMAFTLAYCVYNDLSDDYTKQISLGALLHDTGKSGVLESILQKRESLTSNEYEEMKLHVLKGYDILKSSNFSEIILNAELEHHERLDGSGYPNGVKDISFEGQLIGIIDCYEALISHYRPYKKGVPTFETAEIIMKDVELGKYNRDIFLKFIQSRKKENQQ